MIIYRDYQLEAIDAIWSAILIQETALCVMPTGSGKTEIFIGFIKKCIEVMPHIRIVILMGRVDLVEQTDRRLRKIFGHQAGVYCSGLNRKETTKPIIVASIHSADVKKFLTVNLIIIDEVHNLDQESGAYFKFIEYYRSHNPKLKLIGFTATPMRENGLIYGDDKLFKKIDYKKSIQEIIALGYLVPPVMKASAFEFDTSNLRIRAGEYRSEDVSALVSNKDLVTDQVKDALARMKDRKCIVWATANIEHCNMVADVLMNFGEIATTIHSKLNKNARQDNLAQFKGGAVRHMSFVTILSEGFDHPPIDCVVLMRPTRSPILYVQMVGRGLRLSPDKTNCLVLDYGQVVKNLGPIDDPKVKGRRSDGMGDAVMKLCPKCQTYVFGGLRNCIECSFEFPPPPPVYEKLDKVANGETSILSQPPKPETIIAGPLEISDYTSKSDRACFRFTYVEGGLLRRWGPSGISEYFLKESPWAMSKLAMRLKSLEIESCVPGEYQGTYEVTKIKDGKYDKILSVKKISNENPHVENKKTYLDELDTSFDFGKNKKEGIENELDGRS